MDLIITNTTSDTIYYLSNTITINANSNCQISPILWYALANDSNFIKDIRLNNIIINDGVSNYKSKEALDFVLRISNQNVSIKTSPFSDKILSNGKRLFTRVHGITAQVQGDTDNIDFIIQLEIVKRNGFIGW